MGRKSSEDVSGALFRAGGKPPSPPAYLSPEAKAEWWQIVNDRPADYFRPSNFAFLAHYCAVLVAARKLFRYFETLELSRPDYGATVSEVAKLSAALSGFATKLRLLPSNEIDRRSRKMDEKGSGESEDDDPHHLLGGFAVWGHQSGRLGAKNVVKMKRRPRKPKLDAPPL
jgi:hypothetical protein